MTAHARARVSRLQRTEASRCERSDLILFGLGEHRVISLLAEPVRASDSYFPNQASVSHFPVSRIPFRNGRRDRFRSVHVARNVASRAPQNRPIDSSRVFGPERRHARAQDKRKRGGSRDFDDERLMHSNVECNVLRAARRECSFLFWQGSALFCTLHEIDRRWNPRCWSEIIPHYYRAAAACTSRELRRRPS